MNLGDLFKKKFKIYSIAVANRQLLAPQFLVCCVFAYMSMSCSDLLAVLIITGTLIWRTTGYSAIPLVGPFTRASSKNVKILGVVSQATGILTGTVLACAMLSDKPVSVDALKYSTYVPMSGPTFVVIILLCIGMYVLPKIVSSKWWIGLGQTFGCSAVLAIISRNIPLYSAPLTLIPVMGIIRQVFPLAVTSSAEFIPLLQTEGWRFSSACTVVGVHCIGPILIHFYLLESSDTDPSFVSTQTIGQEFFYSMLIGFVSTKKSPIGIFLGAWLATAGANMVHLCSAISLGANGLDNGRLLARLIWQSVGSLVGATLVKQFVNSNKIDFDEITDIQRTTDGKRIDTRKA